MEIWKYTAMSKTGVELTGEVRAETEEEACEKVRARGVFLTLWTNHPNPKSDRLNRSRWSRLMDVLIIVVLAPISLGFGAWERLRDLWDENCRRSQAVSC